MERANRIESGRPSCAQSSATRPLAFRPSSSIYWLGVAGAGRRHACLRLAAHDIETWSCSIWFTTEMRGHLLAMQANGRF